MKISETINKIVHTNTGIEIMPHEIVKSNDIKVVSKTYSIELNVTDSISPREDNDNNATMVCFHNKYNLGDKTDYKKEDFNSWEELKDHLIGTINILQITPIYMYDHSGLTISTSPFNDAFDSGQIGWIFVTKDNATNTKDAFRIINSEIDTYDKYISGDVYMFECTVTDEKGNIEHVDSCHGFYGSNIKENGMLDNIHDDFKFLLEGIEDIEL